jgi:CBS domain-containing protein
MLRKLASIPCGEVHRRKPVCVGEGEQLGRVVALMNEHNRGAVLVSGADGKLTGIFTERDLLNRVNHHDRAWERIPVRDVMTKNPICVKREDPVARAFQLMSRGSFRRLPEVDREGRPVAILTVGDLLVYMAENFPAEFVNLPPDPSREARRPWGG